MSDDKLATQLRNLSNELWPPQQRIIADAAARIASLEAEKAEINLHLVRLEAEREQIRKLHHPKRGEGDNGLYVICDYDKTLWPCRSHEILAQSPAVALAQVKAEAAATALEEAARRLEAVPRWHYGVNIQVVKLREALAAIRPEVK